MSVHHIPPRTGEGDHEVGEGHVQLLPAFAVRKTRLCPSTLLRMVPLPVSGRNFA